MILPLALVYIGSSIFFYKIFSRLGPHIYIGNTKKNTVGERFQQHINNYSQYQKNQEHYTSSFRLFQLYGVENCQIMEITTVVCLNRLQACLIEGNYIRLVDGGFCVNHNIAGRTRQEYRKDNIAMINGKHNCACKGRFTYNGKSQH